MFSPCHLRDVDRVDVLVAFYISSRMFMYYHSLANLNALSGACATLQLCGRVATTRGWLRVTAHLPPMPTAAHSPCA